jgi:hypothetical protein
MSSRCHLARLLTIVVICTQVAEDDSGEAALEATQGFRSGVALIKAMPVVGPAESLETDLGDGNAVQCGVELAVARACHTDSAGGVARPHRHRGHAGMAGKRQADPATDHAMSRRWWDHDPTKGLHRSHRLCPSGPPPPAPSRPPRACATKFDREIPYWRG